VRVPEIVYRLARSPGSTGPMIELFSVRGTNSAASTSVSVSLNGPAKDKTLIVTNLSVDINPGALQQIIRMVISGRTPGGVIFGIQQQGFTEVDDFRTGMNWQGEVAIGGGGIARSILIFDSVFDGGANANAITVSAFGYIIPRGNIAPF